MSAVDPEMTIQQLLQLVADNHHEKIALSEDEKQQAIDLLKRRAVEELDFGEELSVDKVRLIKRVTGAVGLYFK
ncbi:MAG: hypothetical protein KC777_04930 [Cyanobacteria bacterium HKST-UBA02]|nr:hypothetical protein [Candidatus Melainabacteria bacterium]MCA9801304.1 hypothetical protein [Cyanobacteria bacterium HKST-UBA02]